jgi:hypothetical protein
VNSGGTVQGIIDACDKVAAQLPPDVKVIPGHGQLSTLTEVREYSKMLQDTSAIVKQAMQAGKTVDQMKQEKILAAWDKRWSGKSVSTDVWVETIYNSLTNNKNAAFVKHN